jgi:hypothetical protein
MSRPGEKEIDQTAFAWNARGKSSHRRNEGPSRGKQDQPGDHDAEPLRANMTETSCVTAISEQGGKENQHGNDERYCQTGYTREGQLRLGVG